MKRFLMLVGVAVVAGAMYVAAGTASQQSRGPTAKQFKALKAQVASLSKKLKATKSEADAAVGFIGTCFVSSNAGVVGVSQFGDTTTGFLFGTATAGTPRTALDADASTTPGALLQAVDPTCVQAALRHRQTRAGGLQLRGERLR
jgi:outer membrane murein-binding lipoprotein Lpp